VRPGVQGETDELLRRQLRSGELEQACAQADHLLTLCCHASLMADHFVFHARGLSAK